MYYKVSPILIIVLVLVVVALAGLGFAIISGNMGTSKNGNQTQMNHSDIVPVLDLSTNTDDENQETVKITAVATTEDEEGIYSITLPDGSVNRSDNATYIANKNGNYTFKVKGNNGQTSSLTIEVSNIREASAMAPYIPTGFSHTEGEVENGYVIEDKFGNEFVWVPVESGKLTRNTMLENDYEETSNTASALVNSVAKNYGFYIAKYEASLYEANGQKVASSRAEQMPWTNVSYIEAAEASSRASTVFQYEGYQTAIVNSYAWDTVLKWIDTYQENYSTNTTYGNYSGEIRKTGATDSDIKNNVCDLAGNVREWTTEIYKNKQTTPNASKNATNEIVSETVNYRVVRGGGATLSRTASGHTGYKENMTDECWGFRMILYQ